MTSGGLADGCFTWTCLVPVGGGRSEEPVDAVTVVVGRGDGDPDAEAEDAGDDVRGAGEVTAGVIVASDGELGVVLQAATSASGTRTVATAILFMGHRLLRWFPPTP
jgi:hypothetical protein